MAPMKERRMCMMFLIKQSKYQLKDKVDFVIFAGDIFHEPNPSGRAIMQMANAVKKLKKNKIKSFFVLGEHDTSRIRGTPVPYVYQKLEFSKIHRRWKTHTARRNNVGRSRQEKKIRDGRV